MATNAQLTAIVDKVAEISRDTKALESKRAELKSHVDVVGFDAETIGQTNPSLLENGFIQGTSFTPADVSNAMGALSHNEGNYAAAWTAGKVNLEKLCPPGT